MLRCTKCAKSICGYLTTAYGELLCEDCWDSYICTPSGKLEYLIGICKGDYPATDFDNEFLLEVVDSWNKNKEVVRQYIPESLFKRCDIRAEVLSKL